MKCKDCVCWVATPDYPYGTCIADPNFPAPCEYDDESEDYDQ